MLEAVWRVSTTNFDVNEFCELYQIKNITAVHIQGEKGRKNKINEKSGLNVSVSENCISEGTVSEIESFIHSNIDALNHLKLNNISSELDIGCFINIEQFMKSINIPPSLLGLMHQYDINLKFSAYPSINEEET